MFNVEQEFEKFWYAYDKKYVDGVTSQKGNRTKAVASYKKAVKTQTMADKLFFSLVEQKKQYDKLLELNKRPERFKHVVTWINQKCWELELDSMAEVVKATQEAERKSLGTCSVEGCSREIHGPMFNECSHHVSNTPERKKKVVAWFMENDLMKRKDETTETFINRCKAQAKASAGRMNKRIANV